MALENAGYLGSINREALQAALEVGNASSHRGHNPTSEQTTTVMDIIENVIQATVLEEATDKLKAGTPKRRVEKKQE